MRSKKQAIDIPLSAVVAVTLAAGLTVSAGRLAAQDNGEINALIWCDHADPSLVQPFEEEYGARQSEGV